MIKCILVIFDGLATRMCTFKFQIFHIARNHRMGFADFHFTNVAFHWARFLLFQPLFQAFGAKQRITAHTLFRILHHHKAYCAQKMIFGLIFRIYNIFDFEMCYFFNFFLNFLLQNTKFWFF